MPIDELTLVEATTSLEEISTCSLEGFVNCSFLNIFLNYNFLFIMKIFYFIMFTSIICNIHFLFKSINTMSTTSLSTPLAVYYVTASSMEEA